MIIGNKNNVAIQFKADNKNPKMGYAKLWFQNLFLGTIEDFVFLNYVIFLLDEILNSRPLLKNIENKSKEEIFELLASTTEKRSDYMILGSTFTDDFEIYSFEAKGEIFLFWKVRSNHGFFEELKNYSREIHFAQVAKIEIENVKTEFFSKMLK